MKAATQAASTQTSRPMRVRNERMVRVREGLGFASARACANALGLEYQGVVKFERGELSPLSAEGTWREVALRMAERMAVTPETLWPREGQRVARERRAAERAFLMQCGDGNGRTTPSETTPMQALIAARETTRIRKALGEKLADRTRGMVHARVVDEKTLGQIGHRYGVSGQRAREVIARGFDILRSELEEREVEPPKPTRPAPIPKLACCIECGSQEWLTSEETSEGRRVYTCAQCRGVATTKAHVMDGSAREVRGTFEVKIPPPVRTHQQGFDMLTRLEVENNRRQRDLLRLCDATSEELYHWVETGQMPMRCLRAARMLGIR